MALTRAALVRGRSMGPSGATRGRTFVAPLGVLLISVAVACSASDHGTPTETPGGAGPTEPSAGAAGTDQAPNNGGAAGAKETGSSGQTVAVGGQAEASGGEAGATGTSPLSTDAAPAAPDGTGSTSEAVVGADGGQVTLGEVALIVPPGVLAAETTLRVTEVAGKLDEALGHGAMPLYRFEPTGLSFSEPVTVRLPKPAQIERFGLATLWSQEADETRYEVVGHEVVGDWVYVRSLHFSYLAGVYVGEPAPDASFGSCGDGTVNTWPRFDHESMTWRDWAEDCDEGDDNSTQCPYGPGCNQVCDPTSCENRQGALARCLDGKLQAFSPATKRWFELPHRTAQGFWGDLPPGETSHQQDGYTYEVCDRGKVGAPRDCREWSNPPTECLDCASDCLSIVTRLSPHCGDGERDDGFEACDGADLGVARCTDLGFAAGSLACDAGCAFDASGCVAVAPSVSANAGYTCAVGSSGKVACWGKNDAGQADPVSGSFRSVATGPQHACALRADGSVACWGAGGKSIDPPGGDSFVQLACGDTGYSCGLRANGTLRCWNGAGDRINTTLADGVFSKVAIGQLNHVCVLTDAGGLSCYDEVSQTFQTPSGSYLDLSMQGSQTLLIDSTGKLQGNFVPASAATFDQAAAGGANCGLTPRGDVTCFEYAFAEPIEHLGPFATLSAGSAHVCAARATGEFECWPNRGAPDDVEAAAAVPSVGYTDVVTATGNCTAATCAWSEGQIDCLGGTHPLQRAAPGAPLKALALSCDGWGCALGPTGAATCWNAPVDAKLTAPAGTFSEILASDGEWVAYGLRQDHTVACWGINCGAASYQPPSLMFEHIAGNGLFCGIAVGAGSLHCWGPKFVPGEWTSPLPLDGDYVQLAVGGSHGCALRPDRSAVCFGQDYQGNTVPPSGGFLQLALADRVSLGLRDDGSVAVWGGYASSVKLTPAKPGPFNRIAAASGHACGLRADGGLTCWGNDYARLP